MNLEAAAHAGTPDYDQGQLIAKGGAVNRPQAHMAFLDLHPTSNVHVHVSNRPRDMYTYCLPYQKMDRNVTVTSAMDTTGKPQTQ